MTSSAASRSSTAIPPYPPSFESSRRDTLEYKSGALFFVSGTLTDCDNASLPCCLGESDANTPPSAGD